VIFFTKDLGVAFVSVHHIKSSDWFFVLSCFFCGLLFCARIVEGLFVMSYSLISLLERVDDENIAFHEFRDDCWVAVSWKTLVSDVVDVACAIMRRGLARGSRVALLGSGACWMKVYLGSQVAGMIPVGLYHSSSAEEVELLLNDSGAKILFASRSVLKSVDLTALPVVLFDEVDASSLSGAVDWSPFLHGVVDLDAVTASIAKIDPSDAAVLIYTSGTTGRSKGVVLTFGNINAFLVTRACSMHGSHTRALSFLPLSHLAGQAWTIWLLIAFRGQVWFSRGLPFLVQDLQVCHPTTFFAPPRVYEGWFREFESVPDKSMVKKELGLENCSDMICAAAPFDARTLSWFHGVGFFVREVYGLSEVPIATSSAAIPFKSGSVGKAEVEVSHFGVLWLFFFFF
jgi:long-chain acyl-CoA synthetase